MSALSLSKDAIRPLNRWANDSIRPGAVGSVGDVLGMVRFKHSAPDLPIRYDKEFSGKNGESLGSNVSDGQETSFNSGGGPAYTIDSNWGGRRRFKTSHGWIMQDLRAEDRLHEPISGSTPQYSWRNKIATTYKSMRTGDRFLPLPGPYMQSPGEVDRGGQVPIITNVEPGQNLAGRPYISDVEQRQPIETSRPVFKERTGRNLHSASNKMR